MTRREKSAKAAIWYRNALRHAFVHERVDAYLRDGIPTAEALARPSMDLGHGDGRGR